MKLLLENWRQYITEEEEEQKLYSFDFDNTLIRYNTLEDGDIEYIGPHKENIQLAKDLAAEGNKVIIVTSRKAYAPGSPKMPWDDSPSPEELIAQENLPIEEIYYTNRSLALHPEDRDKSPLKAWKLVELGVSKHWDDDEEEVEAARSAGVEAVLVPTDWGITEGLRNKWINHLAAEQNQN